MRAITIRQPWAWAIVHGGKRVENRNWYTAYRGPVAIHSSSALDDAERTAALAFMFPILGFHGLPGSSDLTLGCIIGVANLIDCVRESDSPWFTGPFGFVLDEVRPVRPIRIMGQLGLWHCPAALANLVEA